MTKTNPEKLSAYQILAIQEPERLFMQDLDQVKSTYRALSKLWFPDLNKAKNASEVFQHITKLREKAEEKLANGTWQEAGSYTCRLKNGKIFRVSSDVSRPFDLGTMHISKNTITYVVKQEYADLFKNAVAAIGAIQFTDDKMKNVYEHRLPIAHKTFEAEDALILTVQKHADDVCLRDLLKHIPKKDLDRHAAWITSRMHEMVRFLDHNGIAHNAITLDNLFVSPAGHTAALIGGWWYAAKFGDALKAVPGEALDLLPDAGGKPIPASGAIDRELIRAAAREVLGDRGGTRLVALKAAPQPMLDYLRMPSSGKAQQDLQDWYQSVLQKSFGARRFIELKVSYRDVYQPGG